MSNLPYRPAKKPTQYQYEFTRSWAPVWGFLGGLAVLAAFLLWPAALYHGEKEDAFTGQEHWAWNAHSTIAVGTWWGILLLAVILYVLGTANSPQVRTLEKSQQPVPPDFPDLRHLYETSFLDPPPGIHFPY
jgi:hypothetical protein